MLAEVIRCGKSHSGTETTYENCQLCFLPYDDHVERTTPHKCCSCGQVASCGRFKCEVAIDVSASSDWKRCACGNLSCCDCPQECCVCKAAHCEKCMEYCGVCDESCCKACYVEKNDTCIKCRKPNKKRK